MFIPRLTAERRRHGIQLRPRVRVETRCGGHDEPRYFQSHLPGISPHAELGALRCRPANGRGERQSAEPRLCPGASSGPSGWVIVRHPNAVRCQTRGDKAGQCNLARATNGRASREAGKMPEAEHGRREGVGRKGWRHGWNVRRDDGERHHGTPDSSAPSCQMLARRRESAVQVSAGADRGSGGVASTANRTRAPHPLTRCRLQLTPEHLTPESSL